MVIDCTVFIVSKRNSHLNEFKIKIVLGVMVRRSFTFALCIVTFQVFHDSRHNECGCFIQPHRNHCASFDRQVACRYGGK